VPCLTESETAATPLGSLAVPHSPVVGQPPLQPAASYAAPSCGNAIVTAGAALSPATVTSSLAPLVAVQEW